MSKFVSTQPKIWFRDRAIAAETAALEVSHEAEAKDSTTFANDTRINVGGLKVSQIQVNGFIDTATLEPSLFPNVGVSGGLISIAPQNSPVVGGEAFFLSSVITEYNQEYAVGEMAQFSLASLARAPLVRGQLAHDGSEASTGNGTAIQLGAVSATQKLYAGIHVLSSSGDGSQTLDVIIQSDDAMGMASPLTRITFSQFTTSTGFAYLTTDGAITDGWFRAQWTIGGTGSPSFNFVVVFGVQ